MKKLSLFLLLTFIISFHISAQAVRQNQYLHIVDYQHPTPLTQIMQKYSALDLEDGDLTSQLIFETEYHENTCTIGYYELKIYVSDSRGNTTIQYDGILVRDFIAPIASVKQDIISLEEGTIYTFEEAKSNLCFNDNLDELMTDIYILGLQDTPLEEGQYSIKAYCVDSSTNASNMVEFTLNVGNWIEKIILPLTLDIHTLSASHENIIQQFKQVTELPNNFTKLEIVSDYFKGQPKEGIYAAQIILYFDDDTQKHYYFKLNVQLSEVTKSAQWIWISAICIGILVIVLIIIYKKRA